MDRSIVFKPREPVMPGGVFLNCLCLLAVSGCLGLLLYFQWVRQEPPCPLCLLQRTGIILTGIGFMRNLRFGVKSSHYGMSLIGALLTGVSALLQLALEGMPGGHAHGAMLLGLHFYTLSALFSLAALVTIAGLLGFKSAEYPGTLLLLQTVEKPYEQRRIPWWRITMCAAFIVLVGAHLASSMADCDPNICDENLIDRLQLQTIGSTIMQ
ncbi:disulfide bond formation protein B [Herbaspirillum sp. AP02]|uniref:disulfide bond formation protein B n=1 Tax=unclassified Herbaspirillum TaxID=2624150 RepID=UPI0015DB80A4|nr:MULTISPECIES: disulfide bond formation protein B [unclassified Herbaspirillum]MBG7622145.1 disulfide bond formation protein B [Herbaspirillum sp. AP02]NZD69164.1 disulfide bond formation protein B [Herbaspirillum sp. AP21]